MLRVAQILDVRRRVSDIGHTFIKRNVRSGFDVPGSCVKVHHSMHGNAIAKENTRTSMDIQFDIAVGSREDVNPASDHTK